MAEMTAPDRRMAVARLDQFAREIADIARWLDAFGDDCDKAACLLECSSPDLLAATWILKPADHSLPQDHVANSRAMRG
jgi:hypothetical protein